MVNLDPDSASPAPEVLKAVVGANQNNAGIYGAVTRIGRLAVGQTILLRAATEKRERGSSKYNDPERRPTRRCANLLLRVSNYSVNARTRAIPYRLHSMQTVRHHGIGDALTSDRHFEQEGFRALFRVS
jgi:hypothetical protein